MSTDLQRWLVHFNTNPPASAFDIEVAEGQLGTGLPGDYVEFLRLSNGGEGFVGTASYLILWGTGEIAALNSAYDVHRYIPGMLMFGSDGGAEAFGFDMRTREQHIVQVPFVGMNWSTAMTLGESFSEFLEYLSRVK